MKNFRRFGPSALLLLLIVGALSGCVNKPLKAPCVFGRSSACEHKPL